MLKILTGLNSWLIKRAITDLTVGDVSCYSGQQLTNSQLLDLLDAQSLFSKQRTVIIDQLSTNPAGWEYVSRSATELASDPDLRLLIVEDKPDGRSKLMKQAKQAGWVEDFPLPKDSIQAGRYLEVEARRMQLQLASGVARMIVERVGLETWSGCMALQKLATVGRVIDAELVAKYIPPSLEVSAFEVLDQLLAGQTETVVGFVDEMERTSSNARQFFGLIVSQISNLLMIKVLGKSVAASELKLHPFVASKLAAVAQRLSLQTIKQMITILARADCQLKTNSQSDWLIIKIALVRITQLV